MPFASPTTEEPLARANQANQITKQALDDLIADANAAGWATDEITAAIFDAAAKLKDANLKVPDPADDPAISDEPSDGGQLGHGEQFD